MKVKSILSQSSACFLNPSRAHVEKGLWTGRGEIWSSRVYETRGLIGEMKFLAPVRSLAAFQKRRCFGEDSGPP
jgi:hypothetical protein